MRPKPKDECKNVGSPAPAALVRVSYGVDLFLARRAFVAGEIGRQEVNVELNKF